MKKQEFIDALYAAGWESTHDAQRSNIEKLWAELFPTAARIASEIPDLIESAHQAGQYDNGNGVDPSYSNARKYRLDTYAD